MISLKPSSNLNFYTASHCITKRYIDVVVALAGWCLVGRQHNAALDCNADKKTINFMAVDKLDK